MDLTPLRAAALGLAAVASVTLAVSTSRTLARRIDRNDDPDGLRRRCRIYSLSLLAGAIAMVLVSEAVQ